VKDWKRRLLDLSSRWILQDNYRDLAQTFNYTAKPKQSSQEQEQESLWKAGIPQH
jgi:hypothetical protein